MIIGIVTAAVLSVLVLITYWCYRMAFYADRSIPQEEYPLPKGEAYEPYREQMVQWIKETRQMPHQDVEITSFDGLKLRGRYYEFSPNAPVELMFHGYRGSSERDLCGGVQRCFKLGRSALLVDQRAHGNSDGHVISFGVNERKDCLAWVDFMVKKFGPDVKIIMTGISMGASTVMMAAGEALPANVVSVLADCGYSSQKEIIKAVIRKMKLPADLLYPFVKLGARIFGGFCLEETTPLEAMKKCKVPIFFVHGENDDFVPCQMSWECYEACNAPKEIFTVPGAGHGLAYPSDVQGYLTAVRAFYEKYTEKAQD